MILETFLSRGRSTIALCSQTSATIFHASHFATAARTQPDDGCWPAILKATRMCGTFTTTSRPCNPNGGSRCNFALVESVIAVVDDLVTCVSSNCAGSCRRLWCGPRKFVLYC